MRVPRNLERGAPGINMTPMIDVVFLLIVFFLVSSHLAQQETQLELNLPDAASAQRPGDESQRRVTFNVLSDGQILQAGQIVPPEQLPRMIAVENRRAQRSLEVRIRSDRTVAYQFVEPILLACAEQGVWKVTFAVWRKPESR
jgi:biopolymer transport protein ExbD